jgi:DNA processing protein
MQYSNELLYQIALTQLRGVGDITAKNLVAYCGSAKAIFTEKKESFLKIPGIAEKSALQLLAARADKNMLKRAEEEIEFIQKNKTEALFFTDEKYPQRLKYCSDSPILLYYRGTANLNAYKIISVVGTRMPTEYGKSITEKLITDLKDTGVLVISGLAYGIDITAHKSALENNIDTVGVLAHGLDMVYPSLHESIAKKMIHQGGLLSDFMSKTNPDKENFPKRNRIVAGMCDAVVVVETKLKGGSLITAEIANSYSKDVFAFPGRAGDEFSSGCNAFIKRNKASLIENAADLLYAMSWEEKPPKKKSSTQIPLLLNLNEKEQKIIDVFSGKDNLHVDELSFATSYSTGELAGLLLQMEFNNIVKSLPGKLYKLNN